MTPLTRPVVARLLKAHQRVEAQMYAARAAVIAEQLRAQRATSW
jgi:hypothetical protein